MGEFFFDVGLLGPCKKHAEDVEDVASMPRTLQSMPRTAKDVAKHAWELLSKPTHLRFPQYPLYIIFLCTNSSSSFYGFFFVFLFLLLFLYIETLLIVLTFFFFSFLSFIINNSPFYLFIIISIC